MNIATVKREFVTWKDKATKAPKWKWVLGLTAGALLLWFIFGSPSSAIAGASDMVGGAWDWTKNQLFTAALPSPANQYADVILRVAQEQDMSPILIYGIGQQESGWGHASGYKQDTGDWSMRTGKYVGAANTQTVDTAPAGWSYPKDSNGDVIPGPYSIPDDGLGWGRGLMQLDLKNSQGVDWRDPYANLTAAVQLFIRQRDQLANALSWSAGPDLDRGAVVAYNHGVAGMVANATHQVDWDTGTAGGDYSNRVLTYAADLWSKVTA